MNSERLALSNTNAPSLYANDPAAIPQALFLLHDLLVCADDDAGIPPPTLANLDDREHRQRLVGGLLQGEEKPFLSGLPLLGRSWSRWIIGRRSMGYALSQPWPSLPIISGTFPPFPG